jgi:hypothetical protein
MASSVKVDTGKSQLLQPDLVLARHRLHHLSQANWSLSNLATMLRLNLFTYRDLREWLHNPFGTPPIVPTPEQLALSLA